MRGLFGNPRRWACQNLESGGVPASDESEPGETEAKQRQRTGSRQRLDMGTEYKVRDAVIGRRPADDQKGRPASPFAAVRIKVRG